jgi:hypothetical protein
VKLAPATGTKFQAYPVEESVSYGRLAGESLTRPSV